MIIYIRAYIYILIYTPEYLLAHIHIHTPTHQHTHTHSEIFGDTHDEAGTWRHVAAAVVAYTLPGMRLFNDGQLQGIHIYVYIYIYMYMYVYIYAYMCIYMCIYMYMGAYTLPGIRLFNDG